MPSGHSRLPGADKPAVECEAGIHKIKRRPVEILLGQLSEASGSRRWASKPAEMMIRSGQNRRAPAGPRLKGIAETAERRRRREAAR